jgi:4-amino-4-deoxy-L-arabinose transferase-like glycosyltransferase
VRVARFTLALAVLAVPAGMYIASASVEPASWDTAELQGVPYILGIPHPTGFPLYVLIGYVWSHLIAFGTVAWRMNVMSAFAVSAAAVAAYATALEFGASLPVAFFATLWFAFTQNVWAHAVRAEAQDLAVACAAIAIYLFLRWMRGAGAVWFIAAFALCGLGMAAHPNALWVLPAFLVGGLIARNRPPLRILAAGVAFLIAALTLYLYLPLRSAYVVTHHLDPAAALPGAGGIFWNYNDPSTLHGLAAELTGSDFQTPAYFLASFNPIHWKDAFLAFVAGLRVQFGVTLLLLALGGFFAAALRDWRRTLVLCIACTAALIFSVAYPNEGDVGRYRILASWIAVPLVGALTPDSRRSAGLVVHGLLIVYLAAGAALAFEHQRSFLDRVAGEGGRWVIRAVRPYVPPGSVIVTGWLDATSLAYGAYVDGSLPGRIIVSDDRLEIPLYRTWAHGRRVFVLINPRDAASLAGTTDYATLDPYHELYLVTP